MKKRLIYALYFAAISFLLINTGIFSDEFTLMLGLKDTQASGPLLFKGKFFYLDMPVTYLTHYIWYYIFRNNYFLLDIVKILYALVSFYLASRFFSIFLDEYKALFASFLFLFFPNHDATAYCFMTYYLTLHLSLYLYAFYLAHKDKLLLAFGVALFASFGSYGTPPLALGLAAVFILNKQFKKALVLIIPNILYAMYFVPLNIVMRLGAPRIIEKFGVGGFLKQFALQILTFIDAALGPSLWLKVYYGITQLSLVTALIVLLVGIILIRVANKNRTKVDSRLIVGSLVMVFASFFIFALTGRYPQLAFNLGDRTSIYGSFLLAYLIIAIPYPKKIKALVCLLLIFAIFGVSSHWKAWQAHQQEVIINIKNNRDLINYKDAKVIYVTGNQYSKYGPFSHIEFFSEGWVPDSVIRVALGDNISALSLNKRHIYKDGYLIDSKYNQMTKAENYINIYDSKQDKLFKLEVSQINSYIASLPCDRRHWIQLLGNGFLKNVLSRFMPRFNYLLAGGCY